MVIKKNNTIPILYLDNTSTFGGAINSLLYFLRALNKSNYTPVLVTAQPEELLRDKFNFVKWRHVKIKRTWLDNHIYKKITAYHFLSSGLALKIVDRVRFTYWLLFITLPEAIRYYQLGRECKVQLVHLNNIMGSQMAGIIAAKLLGVPCIAHLRDFERVNFVTKMYAKMIDAHIAISGEIKKNLLHLGIPEEKIFVVHDSIDLHDFDVTLSCTHLRDEFGLNGHEKLFGIFGRIVAWKGIKEFVHAAALVIRSKPDSIAFIIGDCSDGDIKYLEEVESLIAEYGLEKNIVLTGYRKDVPVMMQMMDVIVHASITPEPFGMVLIEAMAMKKPVVATKMGGPLDIVVQGETGYMVKMGDTKGMGKAIAALLQDPVLCKKFGEQGRERVVRMFSSQLYAQKMEKIYQKFLQC